MKIYFFIRKGENLEDKIKLQIDEELGIKTELNELQCFQLLYSDKIINSLVDESNNYYKVILIEKYGNNYMEIILEKIFLVLILFYM